MYDTLFQSANPVSVDINDIYTEDTTFLISTEISLTPLKRTILEMGVLTPPILKSIESGYIIVSGFRRIAACKSLSWSTIPVRIVKNDVENHECVKIAIIENVSQRTLNIIEQGRAFNHLSSFYTKENELSQSASSFGLPESISYIRKVKKISTLPLKIQKCLLNDTIPMPIALELGKFEKEIGVAFAELFEHLKISLNKQREIITHAKEVAIREKMSLFTLLKQGEIDDILVNNELDRNQKAKEIRLYLKKRRYPVITKVEENYKRYENRLKLDRRMKLLPPKNFEENSYHLKLNFKTIEELEKLNTDIDNLCSDPNFIRILGGIDLSEQE